MKLYYTFFFLLLSSACLLSAGTSNTTDNFDPPILLDQTKTLSINERLSMLEMQKFQMEYDEAFWFNRDFEKVRHILLHLMDSVGKIAKYCESKEHGNEPDASQLINEVFPDLLMHSLQFANEFDIELGEKYEERINSNINNITAYRNAKALQNKRLQSED